MGEPEIKKSEAGKPRPPKLSAERALPQSSAETLTKIIKAYAVASNGGENSVNYRDAASAAGLNPTVVSRNNSFLSESEILISPKYGYYVPAESAVRFAREAAWDESGAKTHLRKLIAGSWYGQVAVQNLTLRSSLTKEDLKRSLAIKCGAGEGDSYALESLIDFILYTGLAEADEKGTIIRGNFDEISTKTSTPTSPISEQSFVTAFSAESRAPATRSSQEYNVSIVIHVHIHNLADMTPEHAASLHRWVQLLRGSTESVEVQVDREQSEH